MFHSRLMRWLSDGVMTARGHASRRFIAALASAAFATISTGAAGAYRLQPAPRPPAIGTLLGPRLTSTVDWWSRGVVAGKWFHLDPAGTLADSFRAFQVSFRRQSPPNATTLEPPLKIRWISDLYWHVDFNEIPEFDEPSQASNWVMHDVSADPIDPIVSGMKWLESIGETTELGLGPLLQAPKPLSIPIVSRSACPVWRVPITFTGLGGEGDRIALVDCEGVVSADAIDRLSVLARLPGTPKPSLPLPLSPDSDPQVPGEWVPGVRLLHPRLLGAIERLTTAFPWRSIAVYSGYRRDRRQSSRHLRGRAIDLAVYGVANEQLFAYCKTLPDMGCGYYPNQPFVHIDVRESSRGSASWVDIALPGQPSVYTEVSPALAGEAPAPEMD